METPGIFKRFRIYCNLINKSVLKNQIIDPFDFFPPKEQIEKSYGKYQKHFFSNSLPTSKFNL